jgi:hypothetical protein
MSPSLCFYSILASHRFLVYILYLPQVASSLFSSLQLLTFCLGTTPLKTVRTQPRVFAHPLDGGGQALKKPETLYRLSLIPFDGLLFST